MDMKGLWISVSEDKGFQTRGRKGTIELSISGRIILTRILRNRPRRMWIASLLIK
jgi:hypothetical protein